MMTRFKMLGVAAAAVCLLVLPGHAQETPLTAKEVAGEALARNAALHHIREVERIAGWILHVESMALIAGYGEWPEERSNWPEDWPSSFDYGVFRLRERLDIEVVDLRIGAVRAKAFREDEVERYQSLLQKLSAMIADSVELFELLKSGDEKVVNEFYRSRVRTAYERITSDTYTMAVDIEADLRRLKLDLLRIK